MTTSDISVHSAEVVLQLVSADAVLTSPLSQRLALTFPRARAVTRNAAAAGLLRIGGDMVRAREGRHLVVVSAVTHRSSQVPTTATLVAALCSALPSLAQDGHAAVSVALDTRLSPAQHAMVLRQVAGAHRHLDMTLTVHVPARWATGRQEALLA